MIFTNLNNGATNSSFTVTFGNNLREASGLTAIAGSTYTVSFVASAGTMMEIGRAGPLQPG
jgi:hypothetical protein